MIPSSTLRGEELDNAVDEEEAARPPRDEIMPPFCDEVYLTVSDAAHCLSDQDENAVRQQIKDNRIVAWPGKNDQYSIPAAQFRNGAVVPGIPEVLNLFGPDEYRAAAHRSAWYFLRANLFVGDASPRPIDMLRDASADDSTTSVLERLALAKKSLDYGDHH